MLKSLPFFYIILVLSLPLENNVVHGSELKSKEMPIINDSSLKVELIYQGDFKVQPYQSSPVSTMTFLGNDILILSKNDGTIYRIKNGTLLDAPLLDVNVVNKRERGLLGIATSKTKDSNVDYVFVYYTESKKRMALIFAIRLIIVCLELSQ